MFDLRHICVLEIVDPIRAYGDAGACASGKHPGSNMISTTNPACCQSPLTRVLWQAIRLRTLQGMISSEGTTFGMVYTHNS